MGSADELFSRIVREFPIPETQIRKEALSYALDHMNTSPAMKSLCLDLLENALSSGDLPQLTVDAEPKALSDTIPEEGNGPIHPVQTEFRNMLRDIKYRRQAHHIIKEGLGLD